MYLDLALADAALAFNTARHGLEAEAPSRAHLYPTNDVFETGDGRALTLGIIEPQFWQRFVAATADIAPDFAAPAWAEETGRLADGDALHARIAAVMRTRSSSEWLQRLARHDVPAQLVLSPAEAARSPQTRARELVMEHEGQRHLPFPVHADHRRGARLDRVAGAVGADADPVLIDLGLSAAEIDALRSAGALAPAPR